MNKILISSFTMGPITKGQELIIDGENSVGYNFKGIAGLWDKELFEDIFGKYRIDGSTQIFGYE